MTIFTTAINILINGAIAQGLIMPFLYPVRKLTYGHRLLSFIVLDLSLIVFNIHYLNEGTRWPFLLAGPFIFLLGPLLFFYLRNMALPPTRIGLQKDLIHFVPFIVFAVLSLLVLVFGREGQFFYFLNQMVGSPWIFLIFLFGFYLFSSRQLISLHKLNIENRYSNLEGMDISWLKTLIWVFFVIFIFITIGTPGLIHGVSLGGFNHFAAVFFSLIVFFITYKGLRQREDLLPLAEQSPKSTNLPDARMEDYKVHLLRHMRENQPYLDPELTLVELATQLGIGRNQLSAVLNHHLGDNFYNFINAYRIEEVKRLIKVDDKRQYTLFALAQEAGFRSKTTFNEFFKKLTGTTPSKYRGEHI